MSAVFPRQIVDRRAERRPQEHPQGCNRRQEETHNCALAQSNQDRAGKAGSEGRKPEAQTEGGVTV